MEATGGVITDNGSYKVHTFTTGGTFTCFGAGTVQVLVIGGGGATDTTTFYTNYGGGAGAFTYDAAFALTSGTYAVTIGLGATSPAGSGGNSSFSTLSARGGYGNGTSGDGNPAGSAAAGPYGSSSGGGGGSGEAGGNAYNSGDNTVAGNSGAGTACAITGTNLVYACGGVGGYRNGGSSLPGSIGTRLYGDGGSGDSRGGAVDGVVIISYLYSSADSGLRIGTEKIASDTLTTTHKLRFAKGSTVVGLPLVDPASSIASAVRIYDGTSVKALVKLP